MPDVPLLRSTLRCEVAEDAGWHSGAPADLTIEILEVECEAVRCRLCLTVQDVTYFDERAIFVADLTEFAAALHRLRQTLDGSTQLLDFDGEPILCFSVVDRGRGRIAVGGNFHPLSFFSTTTSSARFVSPDICNYPAGIRVAFEGIVCDQSYLPDFYAPIARFGEANR